MNADSHMGAMLRAEAPLADRIEAMHALLGADLADGTLGGTTETGGVHLRALHMALAECLDAARQNGRLLSRREAEHRDDVLLVQKLLGGHRSALR